MTELTAFTLLRDAEAYLSALHVHVARQHDDIGADLTCGGCLLRDRIAAALPELAAVPVPPPADRAALRDRIADALADADGWSWAEGFDKARSNVYPRYQKRATAVLAVLPEPTNRRTPRHLALHPTPEHPMTRYRKRPVEIEAVQWTGTNADQLRALCTPFDFDDDIDRESADDPEVTAAVRESAGGTWVGLVPGDWVVRRGADLDRVSGADFERLYEPVPAVEPPPVDRAAVLREAADDLAEFIALHGPTSRTVAGWNGAVGFLRRLAAESAAACRVAAETPQPETHPLMGSAAIRRKLRRWAYAAGHIEAELDGAVDRMYTLIARDIARGPAASAQPGKEAKATTACGPVPDQCDPETGEPCANHEREQSHRDNDHSLCRRDECEVLRQS